MIAVDYHITLRDVTTQFCLPVRAFPISPTPHSALIATRKRAILGRRPWLLEAAHSNTHGRFTSLKAFPHLRISRLDLTGEQHGIEQPSAVTTGYNPPSQ